jgi:putative ABC transport system substrate-binding protein
MRRREFIALLAGAAGLRPAVSEAQQPNKVYRFAMLQAVERYSLEGHVENSSAIARSVVSRNPDLIFTVGDWMVKALRETNSTVPIVMISRDPVAEGLTQSLARPTGNITGVMVAVSVEIYAKRIQLLREIVPTLSRVGILMGPEPSDFETQTRQIVQTAGVAVVEPTRVESNSDAEYRRVLTPFRRLAQRPFWSMIMYNMLQNDK